eukprot:1160526-Pelagomonas_calceolata.AAC.2
MPGLEDGADSFWGNWRHSPFLQLFRKNQGHVLQGTLAWALMRPMASSRQHSSIWSCHEAERDQNQEALVPSKARLSLNKQGAITLRTCYLRIEMSTLAECDIKQSFRSLCSAQHACMLQSSS